MMKSNKLEKGLISVYEKIVQEDFVAQSIAEKVSEEYRLITKNPTQGKKVITDAQGSLVQEGEVGILLP